MDIKLLEEIGLTKSEIKVYYALLELGSTTTGRIVDKADVASSKIYEILDKLIDKGLASYIIKAGTKHFEAAPPERIIDYIEKKQNKINNQKEDLKKILPELELKRQLSKYKSEAKIYKGMKGLETAFNEIFNVLNKGDILYTFVVGRIDDRMNRFFIRHYSKRAEKGIKTKTIFSETGRKSYESRKHIELFEAKILPGGSESPATVAIYKDKVNIRIGDSDDVLTIVIDNKKCAQTFMEQFEALWNQDVTTTSGFKKVTQKFDNMLSELKKGDEYYVLGASLELGDKQMNDWLDKFHINRVSQGTKVKFLSSHEAYKPIAECADNAGDKERKITQIKKLSPEFSAPFQINLWKGDRVWFTMWHPEIRCFEILSKDAYKNFKTYFDALWEQDIIVTKGFDAFREAVEDIWNTVGKGEAYDVLGAAFGEKEYQHKYADFFENLHKKRIEKGIKARLIFQQGSEEVVRKYGEIYHKNAEVKFTSQKTESPVAIFPYADKTHLVIQKEEPTIITIKNKEISDSFKKYFEEEWNQEARVVKGLDAIQDIFEDMLESGSCDLIGARGYFIDCRPKYVEKWNERAKKSGFKMRNIVDTGIKGHTITKFSFAETKYTLEKEFVDLSVFWIFGNKVAISNWAGKEPIATIIENKQIHDMYKKQFELLWKKK